MPLMSGCVLVEKRARARDERLLSQPLWSQWQAGCRGWFPGQGGVCSTGPAVLSVSLCLRQQPRHVAVDISTLVRVLLLQSWYSWFRSVWFVLPKPLLKESGEEV